MERMIVSTTKSKYVNYALDVVFNLSSAESQAKVAAAAIDVTVNAVNHPKKPDSNSIRLSDKGLQAYKDIVRNLVGTILGQGFYIDTQYVDSKIQKGELQSTQSYAIYPAFKLSNYPEAGELNLITRFAKYDDRSIPLQGETSLKTIQVFCKADTDSNGDLNISVNNLVLQNKVLKVCDEFKVEVAEVLDLISTYKEWFGWIAGKLGAKFEYQSTKRCKIFHIKTSDIDIQVRDSDLLQITDKESAYKLVLELLDN